MENIKAVIFDLDGTLTDSLPAIRKAVNMSMLEMGYPERSLEETRAAINNGARHLLKTLLPENVRNDDKILNRALELFDKNYAVTYVETKEPYDGLDRVVKGLKSAGYMIGVLSNKPHPFTVAITRALFDESIITGVLGGREGVPLKPDPTAPREMAKLLGAEMSECVFVGDSNVDMITGKNAGMYTVGVSWGYRDRSVLIDAGADIVVDTPDQLYAVFAKSKAEL